VKARAVPDTGDIFSLQTAGGERRPFVRTAILGGVKASVDIENDDSRFSTLTALTVPGCTSTTLQTLTNPAMAIAFSFHTDLASADRRGASAGSLTASAKIPATMVMNAPMIRNPLK
jgi:hypothetical protein